MNKPTATDRNATGAGRGTSALSAVTSLKLTLAGVGAWVLPGSAPDTVQTAAGTGLCAAIADRPLLAHVFAAGSLLLETCFPLVLFLPRLRWLLIPGVVAMHVGIRIALKLDYSAQWLAAVIVFVNWPVAVAWVRHAMARVPMPREAPR